MDDLMMIKARFDSRGKLATHLQHSIKPRRYVTISSEFDPKALDRIPVIKFDLCLSLSCSERFIHFSAVCPDDGILTFHYLLLGL